MYGKYRHTVDAKGRVFVPSKLREALGSTFYVLKTNMLLKLYPEHVWMQKMEAYKAKQTGGSNDASYLFGSVCQCEMDKQGRVLLPEEHRISVNLTQEVIFVGKVTYAEIWNAQCYEAEEAAFYADPAKVAAAMEALGL